MYRYMIRVRRRSLAPHIFGLTFIVLLQGCSPPADDVESAAGDGRADEPVVYTVNYPLAYFAERIGGEAVDVHMPAPRGVDPATWSPDAQIISAYQQADLILLNGAGYAAWVSRATLPSSRLADTSAGFTDRYVTVEDAVTHAHGPEGEHEHGNVAFTTWLDPELALMQAGVVRDALIRLQPDREAALRSGYDSLAMDLSAMDDSFRAIFAMLGGQPLLFSHPVYQYLASRYDLNARSLHWEPGQTLTAADLDDLNTIRLSHPAAIMIWEAEPMPESRVRLDELGIASVVFAPCGNRPENRDYLACMSQNSRAMEALL